MSSDEVNISGKKIKLRNIDSVPFLFRDVPFSRVFPPEKTPVLFLDFDGTLSPIVNHPEDATLALGMKNLLEKCASRYTTAIVSGRDMNDVKKRVNINGIIYAGSHGYRISGPDGLAMEHEESDEILPLLDQIEKKLNDRFSGGPIGVCIERKRYAIAVHYRNAGESSREEVRSRIDSVLEGFSGIKTGTGKMIIEIKPDIDWHKGKAIKWILNRLFPGKKSGLLPVYIGDDVTDEDAFKTIYPYGPGILVGSHGQSTTAATFRLKDIGDVKQLLSKLFNRK